MPFSSEALLTAQLGEKRIAHTYLFSGPESPAKSALVLGFARALNCERERFFEECDCSSCRKIKRQIHPDVQWFEEEKKTGSVKIEEIRAKLHQASLKPYEGEWKVFIMNHAENLTPDGANALLKTLEEPPAHSVFLLLVESKAHLLETIQSRGFEIRVPPPPEKDPREDPLVRLLEEKGWSAFFAGLQNHSRPELVETLGNLMLFLRDRSAGDWGKRPARSKQCLEAVEWVYETQEALDANANQKLAVTHLEIRIQHIFRHCEEAEGRRSNLTQGIASPATEPIAGSQ